MRKRFSRLILFKYGNIYRELIVQRTRGNLYKYCVVSSSILDLLPRLIFFGFKVFLKEMTSLTIKPTFSSELF